MRYLVVALAISTSLLVSGRPGVPDPSDPEGLDPVETLNTHTRHVYKSLSERGYEVEKGSIKMEVQIIKDLQNPDYRSQLNVALREYLDFLEARGRKEGKGDKGAISTMKLLIVHSWLYSNLEPEMDQLRGASAITVDDKKTLDALRKDVVAELDVRNVIAPVADSILLYTSGVFQSISRDLQANIKAYRTSIVNSKAVLSIGDEKLQAKVIKANEMHSTLYHKNKRLFEFHLITLKMIIQSYITLFDRQLPTGQSSIWLKSSDGSKTRDFAIPPLKPDQFEQLMVQAEMDEISISIFQLDPEYELNDQPYTLDDYRKEQNLMIEKYFGLFDKIGKNVFSNDDDTKTIITVKLLIAQSWIHMLHPDPSLLDKVFPSDGGKTLDEHKTNIEIGLKDILTVDEVVDAIVSYVTSQINVIRDQLEAHAQEMVAKIDERMAKIAMLADCPEKAREVKIRSDLVRDLEDQRLAIDFHEMTTRMCVQSYVLDFLAEPYPNMVTLTSPRGHVTLPLPPLDPDSFEEMAYAGTVYAPDEL